MVLRVQFEIFQNQWNFPKEFWYFSNDFWWFFDLCPQRFFKKRLLKVLMLSFWWDSVWFLDILWWFWESNLKFSRINGTFQRNFDTFQTIFDDSLTFALKDSLKRDSWRCWCFHFDEILFDFWTFYGGFESPIWNFPESMELFKGILILFKRFLMILWPLPSKVL